MNYIIKGGKWLFPVPWDGVSANKSIMTRHKPWITLSAIRWLEGILRSDDRVFEWGSGGSTIWIAQRVSSVISVESDPTWFHRVNEWLTEEGLNNVELKLIGKEPAMAWERYVNEIRTYKDEFDIIFIDGNLETRTICAVMAVEVAGDETVILLDNSIRMSEAAEILEAWATEYVTFYGLGHGNQKWGTTFYYAKPQGGLARC